MHRDVEACWQKWVPRGGRGLHLAACLPASCSASCYLDDWLLWSSAAKVQGCFKTLMDK